MKVLLYVINIFILLTNILAENIQNISNIYNSTNTDLINSILNEKDQACEEHIREIIENLKNSTDPDRIVRIFPFLVYSSFSINDFGDYTSCVRDEKWNYNLVSYKTSIGNVSFAFCFYKECNADYFNTQKDSLVDLINSRYQMNITKSAINISNPKDNMEKLRPEFKNGLIISSIIMIIIASFSFIKLFFKFKENFKKEENSKYENFEGSVSDKSRRVNINCVGTSNSNSNLSSSKDTDTGNKNDKKRQNSFFRFLDHFDLIKHSYSIFNVSSTNITFEYMRIFDGVRCLSTAWVVWGHIFFVNLTIGVKDIYNAKKISQSFAFNFLTSAIVSVDVFFYLSGFLFYFNFAKVEGKIRNKIYFFTKSVAHRYLRLLPFYFIAIFFFTYVFPYIIDGGKSDSIHEVLTSCKTYWISNILYLQNFWGTLNCVGHSWYLCDDMIYFIASLIIFLIFERKKFIIWGMIVLLSIFSCVWSMYVSIKYKYSLNIEKYFKIEGDFFMDFYSQPIARIVPYFMGIFYCELFLATEIYEGKNPHENNLYNSVDKEEEKDNNFPRKIRYFKRFNDYLKENDSICLIIFVISLLEINYAVFSNMISQNHDVQVFDAFVLTFNKIIFVNGLGNILHLVFLGKFQFIKSFLSIEFFSKLGKITYGIYIIHLYLHRAFFYNSDMSFRFSILEYTFYAIGLFSISAILSFIIGIFYESPMISMLKSNKADEKDKKKDKNMKE
jgi:peptidoglycan/LPS O-acetylase OafA/YrhL